MKKILLSAVVLAVAATGGFAQNKTIPQTTVNRQATSQRLETRKIQRANRTPEDMARLKVQRLDKIVTLTDKQKQNAEAIYLKEAIAHKERMAQREETEKQINSLLDKDQIQKLDAAKKERLANMRNRQARRSVPVKTEKTE
ncbi:MAG TPA: hypothetical protein VFL76_08200 [Edaphocola sp.]|nr:hypothetical protein [Edaphocola sp.]